jgi:magnesium chelatase subunit D
VTSAAGSAADGRPAELAEAARHADTALALGLFLIDPPSTGLLLRGPAGPLRDAALEVLTDRLGGAGARPLLRVPVHVSDDRLLGGLDLTATLEAGRPVTARGLLAEADGRVLLLPMAERLGAERVARIVATVDAGAVSLAREGVAGREATRFGIVALDEGEDDERVAPALADRLAFHLDLVPRTPLRGASPVPEVPDAATIEAARRAAVSVTVPDEDIEALCALAAALGVDSLRAARSALVAARLSAALAGRTTVAEADVAAAARLVLAPRATRMPAPPEDEQEETDEPPPEPPEATEDETPEPPADPTVDEDTELLIEAVRASLPPDLLAGERGAVRGRPERSGRRGAERRGRGRGRPAGVRAGAPRSGERLALVDTLRTAAPWQPLRPRPPRARVAVRPEDFRTRRTRERVPNVTLFAVDASGSAAAQRLAEAKGAVEYLLAASYARRDEVALVAFRGRAAEILLPPTRALARARRALAALPGGGGTPLASALVLVRRLAADCVRRGAAPFVVLLTDGRGNITLDGVGDRARAGEETRAAARGLAADGIGAVVVDSSRRGEAEARALAEACRGDYRLLPRADAAALAETVRASRGAP